MPLSDQDRREVREEIKTGFKEILDDQGLDLNTHGDHHTFICSFRKSLRRIGYAAIWGVTVGLLAFIGTAVIKYLGI